MYPFFLDLINENFPEGEVLKKPGKDHLKENNNSVLITKNTFKESVRDYIVVVLMFFFTSKDYFKYLLEESKTKPLRQFGKNKFLYDSLLCKLTKEDRTPFI